MFLILFLFCKCMFFILFLFFLVSCLDDSIQFCYIFFLSVARTQITAPPGFSAPSRAPPPGFFSQDRQNRSVDISLGLYAYVALLFCYPPVFKEHLYFTRPKRNENSFFSFPFSLKKVPSVLYISHSRTSFVLYDTNLVACFLPNKAMLLSSLFREPTP